MDDKDLTILRLLREDARSPLKTIAAEVGLARSSVRERITKLENAGTIRGYRADIAAPEPRAGLRAVLLLRLTQTPSPRTVAAITGRSDVRRCYSVSGDIDLIVEIEGETMDRLNLTRDTIAQLPLVADVTTMPILKVDRE